MSERIALHNLSYDQLTDLLTGWGEPSFRAGQVWQWLYGSLADDFASMGNLPLELRERLAEETRLTLLEPIAGQTSATGLTRKVLFRLHDGQTIESVLMLYDDRRTVCISTQAGCGMGCTFCATGQGGLARNLSPGEIVAQVLHFARELRARKIEHAQAAGIRANLEEHPISNIVLMGMGEPLANFAATWQAIETLTDDRGYNLGARRITLSTVGLVPGIQRLAKEALPINLAVSLHAASNELRDQLLPINQRYPLEPLMAAVHDYAEQSRRRITIEYALIEGVNDAPDQAWELAVLLAGLSCHVNLIPLNPTPGSALRPSPQERVDAFANALEQAGIPATVRMRRGIDIEAGCGQLRQRRMDNAGK